MCEQYGRRALLQGRDWHDYRDLRDNWSTLTRRATEAMVVGEPWLGDAVTRFTEITYMNRVSSKSRGRRWVEHLLRNLTRLDHTPHGMPKTCLPGGTTVVVLGAGPSASNAVKVDTDRGIWLGVNAGTRVVSCQGAVCCESNFLRAKLDEDPVQYLALTSDPQMYSTAYGPVRPVWVGELAWVPEAITGVERLAISGSGATAAVSLAKRWGAKRIVLAGMDLAYTGGRVYAEQTGFNDAVTSEGRFLWSQKSRGMPRPHNALPVEDTLVQVEAYGGKGTVPSTMSLEGPRAWLSAFADANPELECINATEGGSRIHGWREMPLGDVDLGGSWTRADLAAATSGGLTSRHLIDDWLMRHSEELAEHWCYPELFDLIAKHRERAPLKSRWLEARAVRAASARVRATIETAKDELDEYVAGVICDRDEEDLRRVRTVPEQVEA